MQKKFFTPLQIIVDEQNQAGAVKKLKIDSEINEETEDTTVHVPEPIPFVPYAFQTSNSRTAVRSFSVLKDLHQFLVNETEIVSL